MAKWYWRDGTVAMDGFKSHEIGAIDAKLRDMDYKRVAFTVLPDGREVSTVWLGLDHQFDPEGPPLIFETMVFKGDGNEDIRRYSTEDEARRGHEEIVSGLTQP